MSVKNEVTCINCPIGCCIDVWIGEGGKIESITGFQCKEGKEYAPQECRSPKRVLTSTVKTESRTRPVLPVRSKGPVPKEMVKDCVRLLANMKVKPSLKAGDVIVSNILHSGVDVICTDDLE